MVPSAAQAATVPSHDFATPVFGMTTAHDGTLLLADAGAGIVQLGKGGGELIAELPGVTDVSPINPHAMFAVTGGGPGPTHGKFFRVSDGRTRQIADLSGFEAEVNRWFAVELGFPSPGGTVNACNSSSWSCADGASDRHGRDGRQRRHGLRLDPGTRAR